MKQRMSSLLVLVTSMILVMFVVPAQAKGPSRVTVEGPGIEGEVDIIEGVHTAEGFALWFPYDLMAEPLVDAPSGDLGEAYVVTWYAALGAAELGDKPEPMVDRVGYYPEVGAVQVLEVSGGGTPAVSGWHRVDPEGASSFSNILVGIREGELVGAASYVFVTEGTGRGARFDWVAQPLAASGGPVRIGPILVTAAGVLFGLGVWIRPRLYRGS